MNYVPSCALKLTWIVPVPFRIFIFSLSIVYLRFRPFIFATSSYRGPPIHQVLFQVLGDRIGVEETETTYLGETVEKTKMSNICYDIYET